MAPSLPAQGILTVLSASCCSPATSSPWEWQPWQTQDFGVPQWFLKAEAVSSQAVVSLGGNTVQKWLRTHWLGAWLRESFSPPINCVQLNILYISYERAFPLQNMSHTDLVRNSSYNPLLLFPFFPLLGFVFVGFGFSLGDELKNIPRRSYQDYCLQTEKLLLLYYWDHEPRSFYRSPQLLLASNQCLM